MQQQPNKKHASKKVLISTLIICVIILVLAMNYTFISDTILAIGYEPTPEMQDIIDSDNLTSAGNHIAMATQPQLQESADFNEACPNSNENASILGCFGDNQIYIHNVTDDGLAGILEATFAHELLHAVWARMLPWERASLEESISQVYQSNQDLHKHMELYADDSFYDELHSVIGSQISCDDMPDNLCSHYKKYFNDQTKIVAYYTNYSDKFNELAERAKELEKQIEEYRVQIEKLQENYDKEGATLSDDINTFNARAKNGYFKTTSEFEAAHSALVSRQTALNKEYETLSNAVISANKLIEEYNANIARSNELQRAIDSKAEQPGQSGINN